MVIAQGGRFGGWALYVKDGRATFVYNLLGMQEFVTDGDRGPSPRAATRSAPSSPTTVAVSPRVATVTLYYDGAQCRHRTGGPDPAVIFSADETTDIGDDYGMPVSADYAGASRVQRPHRRRADRRRRRRPVSHLIDPAEGRQGRHLTAVARRDRRSTRWTDDRVLGIVAPVQQEEIWDAETASRYDTPGRGMFAADVLGRPSAAHRAADGGRAWSSPSARAGWRCPGCARRPVSGIELSADARSARTKVDEQADPRGPGRHGHDPRAGTFHWSHRSSTRLEPARANRAGRAAPAMRRAT